jgi:hypothetical protein
MRRQVLGAGVSIWNCVNDLAVFNDDVHLVAVVSNRLLAAVNVAAIVAGSSELAVIPSNVNS